MLHMTTRSRLPEVALLAALAQDGDLSVKVSHGSCYKEIGAAEEQGVGADWVVSVFQYMLMIGVLQTEVKLQGNSIYCYS